jgi:hypothetical protein
VMLLPGDETKAENEPVLDQRLIGAVKAIIEQGSCAVAKPVRAGFTTSCIHACKERNERLLILAPTGRILKETVSNASPGNIRIPGNVECPMIQESISDNPTLGKLPLFLPNCDECNDSEWCDVRAILREEFTDQVSLTYAKLEALMVSVGPTASKIRRKISTADVVFLDEAHLLSLPNLVHVKVSKSVYVPSRYRSLRNVYQDWLEFCKYNSDLEFLLKEDAKDGYLSKNLSINFSNSIPITYERQKKAWEQLWKIAEERTMEEHEILTMRDIITIMSATELNIGFISDGSEEGTIYMMTGQSRQYQALKQFLSQYMHYANHIYVSGTIFEPRADYFSELSGKEVKNILFPDIRGTTKKLTLIPDRWRLSSINFNEKLPLIVETIRLIADREKQPIYLIAPNRQNAERIKSELKRNNIKDIFIDYYRSDKSIGVKRNERVCIALGMAETPVNSCDALARGETDDDRWIDSRRLRKQGVDASTWQAVNRVRDPAGETESRIYFIGCRQERVSQVAIWGTNRQAILRDIKEIRGSRGEILKTPIFNIQVDEQIDLPKICSDGRNEDHSQRRKISDYIKQIELYEPIGSKPSSSDCKNHAISSIYINRDIGVVFYNDPIDEEEIISTINAITLAFVCRNDCYAIQYYNSRNSKWNFRREPLPLNVDVIRQHILGHETIGGYNISLNDGVIWCCLDIDGHKGEVSTEGTARKVTNTLQSYGIPFLLEASGSSNSYHIWIFTAKTRTYNAYRFIRQVATESGMKCEVWPKQKKLHKGRYGNPVKFPICINKKTGNRSVFLNPDTFDPLAGPIKLPGIVHLYEIADPSKESESAGMPRVRRPSAGGTRRAYSTNELDYCMKKALEDRLTLDGGAGHNLRVAIVVKAQVIGMNEEEITELFQHQADYNPDVSYGKVVEIRGYDYQPWSCDTLRDKCGNLVTNYCGICPMGEQR